MAGEALGSNSIQGSDRAACGSGATVLMKAATGAAMTPVQVVADALRGELRLSLSLAGVLAKVGSPVADADAVIDELAAVVVGALAAAGYPLGDGLSPEKRQTGDVQ